MKKIVPEVSGTPSFHASLAYQPQDIYEGCKKLLLCPTLFEKYTVPVPVQGKEHCGFINEQYMPVRHKNSPAPGVDKFTCLNCGILFDVDKRGYSVQRNCKFHWSRSLRLKVGRCGRLRTFECCNKEEGSSGCTVNEYHIRETTDYSCMPLFRKTRRAPSHMTPVECGVFALDCEMVYTTHGQELVRCTVVDTDKKVVYDQLAKPLNNIVDYCTRFSGITESDLEGITRTQDDIQRDLQKFIYAETILIGHGIGNDLKTLKLLHSNVIDTTELFPHQKGFPFRQKISAITEEYLRRTIQAHEDGHDSKEDAIACLDLVLLKLKEQNKVKNC